MPGMLTNVLATVAQGWGNALVGATVKGAMLLALAALISLTLRRAPAATRHFLWAVAVSALVLMPLAAAVVPPWSAPVLAVDIAPSFVPSSVTIPSTVTSGTRPDAVAAPIPSAAVPTVATPNAPPAAEPLVWPRREITPSTSSMAGAATTLEWWTLLSMIWFTGALLLVSRLALGLWGTARLARRSAIVDDAAWIALGNRLARQLGITRPVTLLRSHCSGIPMTWGVFYPVILLPADADAWTTDRRVAVLMHELAHIHRFDALTQMIAHLARAMFWINPLVWMAVHRMRSERERACDDFVLAAGMRPSAYASDLLDIARTIGAEPGMAYAALAMARRTELEGRLLAILDPTARRRGMGRVARLTSSAAAIALVVPLAGMQPVGRSSNAPARHQAAAARVGARIGDSVAGTRSSDTLVVHRSVASTEVRKASRDSGPDVRTARAVPNATPRVDVASASMAEPRAAAPEVSASVGHAIALPVVAAPMVSTDTPRNDTETLILVVRAAAKMTSDHEKSSLLLEVLENFVADDSLRLAFLSTTATLTSDYSRRTVLTQFAIRQELTSGAVRQAFFAAVSAMSAGYDQQQVLVSVLGKVPRLTRDEALEVLAASKNMSTSSSKSAVLMAVAEKIGLADEQVRKAYIDVASTLSSDSDYRKAMSAAIRTPKSQR